MTGSNWKSLRSKAEQLANSRSDDVVRAAISSFVEEHKKGIPKCGCDYCIALSKYIKINIAIHRHAKYQRDYGVTREGVLESLERLRKELKAHKDSYL